LYRAALADGQVPDAVARTPLPAPPAAEAAQYPEIVVVQSKFEDRLIRLWNRPRWLAPLAIFGCMVAASAGVLADHPAGDNPVLGPCAFRELTGYDCPGCGGTRMVWYLLHGNVGEAARYHLMALLAVPVVLYAYLVMLVGRFTKFRLPTINIPFGVIIGYGVAWVAFAVLRNLPWAPFNAFYVGDN
jgi:hypothetical protein